MRVAIHHRPSFRLAVARSRNSHTRRGSNPCRRRGTLLSFSRYGPMPTSSYADTETVQAYLFQCDDNGLFAVSLDSAGANIPREACVEGWRFKTAFALGVQEAVPAPIDPEPILRGIRANGYYIWREGIWYGPALGMSRSMLNQSWGRRSLITILSEQLMSRCAGHWPGDTNAKPQKGGSDPWFPATKGEEGLRAPKLERRTPTSWPSLSRAHPSPPCRPDRGPVVE